MKDFLISKLKDTEVALKKSLDGTRCVVVGLDGPDGFGSGKKNRLWDKSLIRKRTA